MEMEPITDIPNIDAELTFALCSCTRFLNRAALSANTGDPATVAAITEAIKTMADIELSRRLIETRLPRQAITIDPSLGNSKV